MLRRGFGGLRRPVCQYSDSFCVRQLSSDQAEGGKDINSRPAARTLGNLGRFASLLQKSRDRKVPEANSDHVDESSANHKSHASHRETPRRRQPVLGQFDDAPEGPESVAETKLGRKTGSAKSVRDEFSRALPDLVGQSGSNETRSPSTNLRKAKNPNRSQRQNTPSKPRPGSTSAAQAFQATQNPKRKKSRRTPTEEGEAPSEEESRYISPTVEAAQPHQIPHLATARQLEQALVTPLASTDEGLLFHLRSIAGPPQSSMEPKSVGPS